MNKELSDAAWRVLSSEFKEEVKKEWKTANNEERLSHDAFLRGCYSTMTLLFGLHNLTSDTEGEEMLIVSRKRVQEMYAHYDKICNDPNRPKDYIESVYEYADGVTMALDALFGSKCLPDEDTDCTPVEVAVAENATTTQTSAEPKFKVGDKVRIHGINNEVLCEKVGVVAELSNPFDYMICFADKKYTYISEEYLEPYKPKFHVGDMVTFKPTSKVKVIADIMDTDIVDMEEYMITTPDDPSPLWAKESDLEPYTEPTANYLRSEGALNTAVLAGNYSSASTCDKQFDNIIKDGFKNHNRLHIAAILAAGMLASEVRCYPVDRALELADKLIAECEKGDNNA